MHFWFLVCYAATQLANQLQQTRISCRYLVRQKPSNLRQKLAIEKIGDGKNWRFWYKTSHFEILSVNNLLQAPS